MNGSLTLVQCAVVHVRKECVSIRKAALVGVLAVVVAAAAVVAKNLSR